jgi:hypothetical protein
MWSCTMYTARLPDVILYNVHSKVTWCDPVQCTQQGYLMWSCTMYTVRLPDVILYNVHSKVTWCDPVQCTQQGYLMWSCTMYTARLPDVIQYNVHSFSFFFWLLYCLSFDLWLLITHLVSSNVSAHSNSHLLCTLHRITSGNLAVYIVLDHIR